MQGETSSVKTLLGAQVLVSNEITLGVDSLVRQSIRHEPPQPIELEHAIELTEDAVMPLAAQFAGNTGVVLQGMGAALIIFGLDAAGLSLTSPTRDEVETLFNRLVAVSEVRPISHEVLPIHSRFFAAMLMLREFMHHLNFANVALEPSRDPV